MKTNLRKRIAILGSGAGSNAAAICEYAMRRDADYAVELIVSTNAEAGICSVARHHSVPLAVIPYDADFAGVLSQELEQRRIDILVLAGFLRLLPVAVIAQLHGNVLNIHPALLPDFGGKGMYGSRVHAAVLAANARTTGATVHLVTEHYDEGGIIAQSQIDVPEGITLPELEQLVKELEHQLYPQSISVFIQKR